MQTLFETSKIKVYVNLTDEVFIKNISSGKCLRIDTIGDNLQITISNGGSNFVHRTVNGLDSVSIK